MCPSAPPVLHSATVLANWKSDLPAVACEVCSLPGRYWELWIFICFLCAESCGDSCSECLLAVVLWDLSHWFSEVEGCPSGGAAGVGALDVQSKLFSLRENLGLGLPSQSYVAVRWVGFMARDPVSLSNSFQYARYLFCPMWLLSLSQFLDIS